MSETTKSLIVVGAGPGVGVEVARRFGRAGYSVGLIRRSSGALQNMVAELRSEGVDACGVAADAHDANSLASAMTALANRFGRLDVLHHAVPGPLGQGYGPVLDISDELLRTFFDARVASALVAARVAAPYLRRSSGSLLFTSGSAGQHAHPGTGVVGIPQAALRMLVDHLRQELTPDGVFVGLVPVAAVPAYRDAQADAARTDVEPSTKLTERVTAADVAEAHFRMADSRFPEEWVVGEPEKGLAEPSEP